MDIYNKLDSLVNLAQKLGITSRDMTQPNLILIVPYLTLPYVLQPTSQEQTPPNHKPFLVPYITLHHITSPDNTSTHDI